MNNMILNTILSYFNVEIDNNIICINNELIIDLENESKAIIKIK